MISKLYFMCVSVENEPACVELVLIEALEEKFAWSLFFNCMSHRRTPLQVLKYSTLVNCCCLWCCFNLQPLQRIPCSCCCCSVMFSLPLVFLLLLAALSLSAASHSCVTLLVMCCWFLLSAAICRTRVTPRRLSSSQRRPSLRASAALLLWQEQRPRRSGHTHTHTHTHTHALCFQHYAHIHTSTHIRIENSLANILKKVDLIFLQRLCLKLNDYLLWSVDGQIVNHFHDRKTN